MRSTILIVLLALLVAAPAAEARKRPHRMTFHFAVLVARDYWEKHDIRVTCSPTATVMTGAENSRWGRTAAMWAMPEKCGVLISGIADAYRSDRDLSWLYCQDVVHEVGHLMGLGHDYGGIMAEDSRVLPWGCDHPRKFLRRSPYALYRTGF